MPETGARPTTDTTTCTRSTKREQRTIEAERGLQQFSSSRGASPALSRRPNSASRGLQQFSSSGPALTFSPYEPVGFLQKPDKLPEHFAVAKLEVPVKGVFITLKVSLSCH